MTSGWYLRIPVSNFIGNHQNRSIFALVYHDAFVLVHVLKLFFLYLDVLNVFFLPGCAVKVEDIYLHKFSKL